jgi:hypothetical protein
MDAASITVGVEAFAYAGGPPLNDATTTASTLSPGRTEIFATRLYFNMPANVDLGLGPSAIGSARILATSKKLVCSAYVAEGFSTPAATTYQLPMIAKTKQRGD